MFDLLIQKASSVSGDSISSGREAKRLHDGQNESSRPNLTLRPQDDPDGWELFQTDCIPAALVFLQGWGGGFFFKLLLLLLFTARTECELTYSNSK